MPEFTPEQRAIIEHKGDLLVLAGPGTGKTFTLLYKIQNLLEKGVPEEKIFLLTFSLKVCQELREKINSLGLGKIKVDTFHGLAYDLYRDFHQREPLLISEKEKREIFKKLALKKDSLKNFEEKKRYYDYLEKIGRLDFDYLLLKVVDLKLNPFKGYCVIIDEFQDLSVEILKFLTLLKEAEFYLFGDPNQAIYGFRGVNLEAIKEFLSQYKPNLKVLPLTQSFRCPKKILEGAEIFKKSPWLVPAYDSLKEGGIIQGFHFSNSQEEKNFLPKLIVNLLGGTGLENAKLKNISPAEIFILGRLRKVLDPLRDFLQREGIPVALPEDEAVALKTELLEWAEKLKYSKIPIEKLLPEVSPFLRTLISNWYELFRKDVDKLAVYMQNLSPQELIFPHLEGINILTIHASKGLEAKVVILYGAEEDLIPLRIFEDIDLDEERRLLYVAITRSKEEFYFISNGERRVYHFLLSKGVSSWLKDFPLKTFSPLPPKPTQKRLF